MKHKLKVFIRPYLLVHNKSREQNLGASAKIFIIYNKHVSLFQSGIIPVPHILTLDFTKSKKSNSVVSFLL